MPSFACLVASDALAWTLRGSVDYHRRIVWHAAPEAVASFLGGTPLLSGCPQDFLIKLAAHVEQREVPKGQAIFAAGAASHAVGFLVEGRATLFMNNALSGKQTKLDDIAAGQPLGEIGAMLSGVNPTSVMADEDCKVFILRKEVFEQVLKVPGVGPGLAKSVAQRFVRAMVISAAQSSGNTPMPVLGAPASTLGKGEIRFVEVGKYQLSPKLLDMVPSRVIFQQRVLPLELREKSILIGMVNPMNEEARGEVRRCLPTLDPEFASISVDDWTTAVVRHKLDLGSSSPSSASKTAAKPVYSSEARAQADKQQLVLGEEVTNLVDRILVEALDKGASDIHIEPEPAGVRVRYRTQGMLVDRREMIPSSFANGIVARIKVLAELDITERRLPQDGRIAASIGKRELSFRISSMATGRGEKIVMRILDPMDVMRPLDHIFLDPKVLELVQRSLAAPYGAIFVAGPTGSGKSSTLYSMLAQRKAARPDNNIVTVEDPIEFPFLGITQSPVNPKIGLDFPTALRALMRQDPDVIMVGELRDKVSTSIAMEAALTGHMVLTSIHGSTSIAVLQRLEHFDIEPVMLSQALNLVIVQRLAPRLCSQCVRDDEVAPALVRNLEIHHLIDKTTGPIRLPRPVGCDVCERTGRKGRVPVLELLSLQEDMRALLAAGTPPVELLERAGQAGQFISFRKYARMLIGRKLLAPADALHVVAE